MNLTKEKHATHTPGPWVVKHDKEGLPFIGVASDPWTYPGTVATVEQEKDARLIASAPEMYETMKAILAVVNDTGPILGTAIGDKLREVLAKVDGGEG
jgi:hypothetical protein